MTETVNIRNEFTGAVGTVPAKLFNSSTFNKGGAWTLYDGPIGADCGCNGLTIPEEDLSVPDEDVTEHELETLTEEEDA